MAQPPASCGAQLGEGGTAMEGLAQPDKRKEIVNRVVPLGAIVAHLRNYQQHPDSQIQIWARRARNVHLKGGHPDHLPVA